MAPQYRRVGEATRTCEVIVALGRGRAVVLDKDDLGSYLRSTLCVQVTDRVWEPRSRDLARDAKETTEQLRHASRN